MYCRCVSPIARARPSAVAGTRIRCTWFGIRQQPRHGCLAAALCQEVAIQRIILLLEKHRRAAIAPLRDMMREAGDDQASKARYATENNFGGQCRQ